MEMYLPDFCYRDKPLVPEALVIHYFSAINVAPKSPYSLGDCWQLMVDLNLPKQKRFMYLRSENDPNNRLYASAHCFITRNGKTAITVPENKQAYHAGASDYKGRKDWNQFSYGIELIGSAKSGFTDEQYAALATHCKGLMNTYTIDKEFIVGHETIAPGRKFDPGIATGNFDMNRLKESL